MDPSEARPIQRPPDVYLAFCDFINQATVQRIMEKVTRAANIGAPAVHLFFQSAGGSVGDGIALYNFFRALTIDLTIYNPGAVQSVATIAYLGAAKRLTSEAAVFMLHRATNQPMQPMQATALHVIAESVALDDRRMETILRSVAKVPEARFTLLDKYDVFVTAQEAVAYGIAHEVGDFLLPQGAQIFNV